MAVLEDPRELLARRSGAADHWRSAQVSAPPTGEPSASVATLKRLRGRAGQHVAAAERSWDCPATARASMSTQLEGASQSDGRDVSGPTTDDAMTRSEEELRVGTTQPERGRARLRKYVVTEERATRRSRCSARRSGSSASRSPTRTSTMHWTDPPSPRRSTK